MTAPTITDPAGELGRAKAAAALPDAAKLIEYARSTLKSKPREALLYPVNALGPTLAAACRETAAAGQIQPAMVGQTLIAAAALLVQGLCNVQTLTGSSPTSLYCITLGESGDGKSTAQNVALAPVIEWQRRAAASYVRDLRDYEKQRTTHRGARKSDASPEPSEQPICPYRLLQDGTSEGMRRDLAKGVCSQGLFIDEGVIILAGYGMSPEHRAKTAGNFSKLWDRGHLSSSRSSEGRIERYGTRFSMHLLIQPQAAADPLNDDLLAHLGFWPRFLAAWPDPLPPRVARPFDATTLPAVRAYWHCCNDLLDQPLPDDADGSPILPLGTAAHDLLCTAYGNFEIEGRCGSMQRIRPFALRAAELACRVAGVITAFEGRSEVSGDTMQGALDLIAYSLQTWLALIDDDAADQSADDALRLYEWLTTRGAYKWSESLAVILQYGPRCVRSKEKRDAALALLQHAGLVNVADVGNDRIAFALQRLPDDQGPP